MRKVWESGFDDEDRAEHIDSIDLGEIFRSDVFHRCFRGSTGIIDYDVNLKFTSFDMRKVVLGYVNEMGRPVWVAHVSLHRYRLYAMGGLER